MLKNGVIANGLGVGSIWKNVPCRPSFGSSSPDDRVYPTRSHGFNFGSAFG